MVLYPALSFYPWHYFEHYTFIHGIISSLILVSMVLFLALSFYPWYYAQPYPFILGNMATLLAHNFPRSYAKHIKQEKKEDR